MIFRQEAGADIAFFCLSILSFFVVSSLNFRCLDIFAGIIDAGVLLLL